MAISAWKYATVWTGRWMIIRRRQHDLCVSYGKSLSSFDIVKDESVFCGWCDQCHVCSLASLPTVPDHYLFPVLLGIYQYRWFNFNHYLWMCVNKLDTWVSARIGNNYKQLLQLFILLEYNTSMWKPNDNWHHTATLTAESPSRSTMHPLTFILCTYRHMPLRSLLDNSC